MTLEPSTPSEPFDREARSRVDAEPPSQPFGCAPTARSAGHRLILFLAFALAVGWASPTLAQDAAADPNEETPDEAEAPSEPEPETFEDAAEAQRAAQQAFAAGDLDRAERLYLRANELGGPTLNFVGLADVRERRGDVAGAAGALRTYLERTPEAADRAAIQARLDNLRAQPGSVIVISDPPGEVFVDGERSGYVTPIELTLTAGTHTIGVTHEGEVPVSHEVTVEFANAQRLDLIAGRLPDDADEGGAEEPAESGSGAEAAEVAEGALASEEPDELPVEGVDEAPVDESFQPRRAAGISLGIAAGSFAIGSVLGFMALSEQSNFRDNPTHASADRGERRALFSDVMFGVAGVAAVTSIVLYVTDRRDREAAASEEEEAGSTSVRVAPVAGPGGAGVHAEVNF